MTKTKKEITEKNSFLSKRTITSISRYKECLDVFSKDFEKEVSLKTKSPIFLDTNILLRYYSISFTAREKLFTFLKKNQERIVITSQIQIEFLKNRENIIQRFFEQVTSKIPKDFNSDIVNKMKNFLDQHKVVLKDYSFVEPEIEKYQADLETLLKRLNDAVELKRKEHIDLIIKDKLLDFLSNCNQCDELTENELILVRKEFDFLAKSITSENVDSFLNKANFVFPGMGDLKEKPEDPYGDYIIFHEIMKYMMNNGTNALFLTFDNSKGDWMMRNKSPHLHYTQNIYGNTGKILYIVDAERTLGELLNINIDSLVTNSSSAPFLIPITPDSLLEFVKNSLAFEGTKIIPFDSNFLKELAVNGYNFIHEIERDIKKAEQGIIACKKDFPSFNSIGIMRWGLRIANPNITQEMVGKAGSITPIWPETQEQIKKYSELNREENIN